VAEIAALPGQVLLLEQAARNRLRKALEEESLEKVRDLLLEINDCLNTMAEAADSAVLVESRRRTRIERLHPRGGLNEQPIETDRGFELVDPRIPQERHHVKNSTFVRSIDEAAYLVEQGFSIRMGAPGKRPSLITRESLRIVRT
jgi:hypothetical protein